MTTSLYMLRCFEIGARIDDLDEMTTGLIFDMYTERSNDNEEYDEIATQSDFDRF